MKIFIVAGEASGDMYGSKLIEKLKEKNSISEIHCFGGDKMKAAGSKLIRHYKDMAFMGIFDVIKNIRKVKENFRIAKEHIDKFQPDATILIDYPGFNLSLAKYIKSKKLKVFYFIPPKVWAWKKKRIYKLKKYTDKIFVIFPFEPEFYKKYGISVEYYGNPLIDIIKEHLKKRFDKNQFLTEHKIDAQKKIVALLPGSRHQEIKALMPYFRKLAKEYSDITFIIAGMEHAKSLYNTKNINNLYILFNCTYKILQSSDAAIVVSGTATLETALLNIPQIVVYLPGRITYFLGKHLIKIPYISLVNIILKTEAVKEIIQENFYPRIASELTKILNDKDYINNILKHYAVLRQKLGYYQQTEVIEAVAERIITSSGETM